jgi:hypothetical protein
MFSRQLYIVINFTDDAHGHEYKENYFHPDTVLCLLYLFEAGTIWLTCQSHILRGQKKNPTGVNVRYPTYLVSRRIQ